MKTQIQLIALAILIGSQIGARAQKNLANEPGYLPIDSVLDVQIVRPEVNINLPRFLLNDVLSEFNGSTNDPLAATGVKFSELIKEIKLIRVLVIEAEDENRSHLDKAVKALRKELETKWTPIVSVPKENVGIYAASDATGEKIAGIAVLVQDGDDVVIGNIVGRVSIGKVIQIASQAKVIPPEVLQKLSGASAPAAKSSGPKETKPEQKLDPDKTAEPERAGE